MKIPLSSRLRVCAGFVAPGERVADIGCDHGYLSIYLLTQGIAPSCIASDVRPGPLDAARRNARKFGVSDRITFCLSDGVRDIPRDFDTLVCAGMGGDTMVHILSDAPWLADARYRLILQCQSKQALLRRYLSEQGWQISEESVLRDGRFLYSVMEVVYRPDAPRLTPGAFYFPPAILENPGPDTVEYYHRTVSNLRLAVSARGDRADETQILALKELEALSDQTGLSFLKEEQL